jgi:hypothetical protein
MYFSTGLKEKKKKKYMLEEDNDENEADGGCEGTWQVFIGHVYCLIP